MTRLHHCRRRQRSLSGRTRRPPSSRNHGTEGCGLKNSGLVYGSTMEPIRLLHRACRHPIPSHRQLQLPHCVLRPPLEAQSDHRPKRPRPHPSVAVSPKSRSLSSTNLASAECSTWATTLRCRNIRDHGRSYRGHGTTRSCPRICLLKSLPSFACARCLHYANRRPASPLKYGTPFASSSDLWFTPAHGLYSITTTPQLQERRWYISRCSLFRHPRYPPLYPCPLVILY